MTECHPADPECNGADRINCTYCDASWWALSMFDMNKCPNCEAWVESIVCKQCSGDTTITTYLRTPDQPPYPLVQPCTACDGQGYTVHVWVDA